MTQISAILFAFIFSANFLLAQEANIGLIGDDPSSQFDSELKEDKAQNKSFTPENLAKRITLADAIEMGLRKNAEQKARSYRFEILDLDWANSYDSFWFPSINLVMGVENHLTQKVYEDNSSGSGSPRTPNGYFGLEISEYTLFNWGRDYLNFLNQKATYTRSKQKLNELRRQLRFKIIGQYFALARAKALLRSRVEILRHTSFIYRLAQEKVGLKKVTPQELLQAKEEYLKSMGDHREYLYLVLQEEQALAKDLGDDVTTSYSPVNELKFTTLATNKDEAYKYAGENNPELLQANVNLNNSTRDFERTLKENLPLPKLSLRFGAYRHNFGNTGVYDTYSTDEDTLNKNVEVVASVNMTWTLFGGKGFLNKRVKESSYLNKRISEIELLEVKRSLHVTIANLIRRIQFLERRVESSKERLTNARIAFDKTLDNYISGKTRFTDMRSIIEALRDAEYEYETAKVDHLVHKMELSETMGLENFPGQNFEKLVIQ